MAVMETTEAPALEAAWLNAWLAAIGVTALVPDSHLSWVGTASPAASFTSEPGLINRLAAALPDVEDIDQLAIAREHPHAEEEFPRKVSGIAYRDRAQLVRTRRGSDFSLLSTVTDLAPDKDNETNHSPFDPSVPRGITLGQRVRTCREQLGDDLVAALERSLVVGGERMAGNGLGFDYRRLPLPTDPRRENYVDPAVELLAFYGLSLIRWRGDGRKVRGRGWNKSPTRRGAFTWPAWRPSLSCAAIDALLDQFWGGNSVVPASTIIAKYGTIAYQPRGQMDSTRGYASERVG